MPITPEEAGFNRGLTRDEQQRINELCIHIDDKLREEYRRNPKATAVYIDYKSLPYELLTKIKIAYENVGWHLRFDDGVRPNEMRIVLCPKNEYYPPK